MSEESNIPANTCPRRMEAFSLARSVTGEDTPRPDGTCPYCGSMSAENLMTLLEAGNAVLVPTDKNYKVYVQEKATNDQRVAAKESLRNSPMGKAILAQGEDALEEYWKENERDHVRGRELGKFYFQHLSHAQMTRFVEIYNEKRISFGYLGYFYVLPFFMRLAT